MCKIEVYFSEVSLQLVKIYVYTFILLPCGGRD
jgi:hypothetical protein